MPGTHWAVEVRRDFWFSGFIRFCWWSDRKPLIRNKACQCTKWTLHYMLRCNKWRSGITFLWTYISYWMHTSLVKIVPRKWHMTNVQEILYRGRRVRNLWRRISKNKRGRIRSRRRTRFRIYIIRRSWTFLVASRPAWCLRRTNEYLVRRNQYLKGHQYLKAYGFL